MSLIIGFLLGMVLYAERANRAGVLGLSDTLLLSLRDRIALEVSAYLEPATHAVLLAHSLLGRGSATERSEQAYLLAASVLRETPQVTNVLFADEAGDFLLVTRAPDLPGGTLTKQIRLSGASRTVTWITRDPAGQIVARREDPADTYDARTRAWFVGARGNADVFWTTPYVFFTEHAPGVTAAAHGPDANPDVVGIDIRLDALSRFLRGLVIGRSGKAYIVGRSGDVIAGPDPDRVLQTVNGQLRPAVVTEVGDPDLTASWDHFRGEGLGTRVIEVSGQRLISIVTPLTGRIQADGVATPGQQDWLLVITVPEADFSGFVLSNARRAALLSLVVVALAACLGVLLVRQSMRADRADRATADRAASVRIQGAAFARMVTQVGSAGPGGVLPQGLIETLAEVTGARRASIWQLTPRRQALRCQDSFDVATSGHVLDLEISRQEAPALIDAVSQGEEIDAADAHRDRRTLAFHGLMMAPFGSVSLFVVPVARVTNAGLDVSGLVMLEDARRDPAALDLTRACAALLAMREPSTVAHIVATDALPAASVPLQRAAVAAPDGFGLDAALVAPTIIPARQTNQAIVLVLRLPGAALARTAPEGGPPFGHQIACAAQEFADAKGIPYLKMLGSTIVAASGAVFEQPGQIVDTAEAAVLMAEMAIALRARCADLFDELDGPSAFGLGLDAGLALGGLIGEAPGLFNIWGQALEGAEEIALSAPDGTVQTSEAAYLLLRQRFFFRPRGLFHRRGLGDVRSYVLGGQA